MDTHRSTQHDQPTEGIDGGKPLAEVEADHVGDLATFGQYPQNRSRAFVGHMLQDRPCATRTTAWPRHHYAVFTTWNASARRPSGRPAASAVPPIQPRSSSSRCSPSPTWLACDLSAPSLRS